MSVSSAADEIAIRARGLCKRYRLYEKPHHRFLDLFGWLPEAAVCRTHTAIDGLDLEIRRGEKVAVIGRNGAGKSTFLKLVTGVTRPTSGSLEVRGAAYALLEIGTGFHPEFTGRENVYSYLAHLGVSGAEAQRRLRAIVEFSELEEYIDQPLKTYSTGMSMRLMFSTSTAVAPDILVLDEVLGCGDAYFSRKSYARIREMCEKQGTTVLLVTHDVYSAANLCERMLWLERGRVILDDEPARVVRAYEDSIRQQEEERLRERKLQTLASAVIVRALESHLRLEIQGRSNQPPPCPLYIGALRLLHRDQVIASVPVSDEPSDESCSSHLERTGSNWGAMEQWHGRAARSLRPYGSPFHKIAASLFVAAGMDSDQLDDHEIELEYGSELPCDLVLRAFCGAREVSLGALPPAAGEWRNLRIPLKTAGDARALSDHSRTEVNETGTYGTGAIRIEDVELIGGTGVQTSFLERGENFELRIQYRLLDPDLDERAHVLVAVKRDGVLDICRFHTRDLHFCTRSVPSGWIRMLVKDPPLLEGKFTVTIIISRLGYWDDPQVTFFTINPGIFSCVTSVIEFSVQGGPLWERGTAIAGRADWSVHPDHELEGAALPDAT